MLKENKKRTRRVRNLVVIFTLSTIVLSVSTYAWFIGMRTVNVSSFDVEIATTDSLSLSLNGLAWNNTISISKDTYKTSSYTNNTNNWAGRGLIPVSSIGDIDTTVSRLKLFEKASLTASAGGYRLMASRVDNYNAGKLEQDGYVVFDLFIKNFSGTQYIKELKEDDEEAIYLTNDSSVKVDVSNGGVDGTGIENSVRVAFAQIGRVAGTTTDQGTITGITCTTDTNVTGICRTAEIWEPNDTSHVANAISWYNTSCLSRVGGTYKTKADTEHDCGSVIDGIAYPTYAISADITSANSVDIYDGASYNGYTRADTLLQVPAKNFTDTQKLLTGTSRPQFITLAPNSITKVRVYIYIEGQDIDNYDFASIGKEIAVKFGFTKERYTEDDIKYQGPDVNQGEGPNGSDLTAPVIKLNGEPTINLTVGTGTYTEDGATATDNVDGVAEGTIAPTVVISGTVNTSVVGTYTVVYSATDTAGNLATKTRTVNVNPAG